MAVKTAYKETDQTYFCTFTCYKWIPLFKQTSLYDNLYKWLNVLIEKDIKVVGFVFMPNHAHCLLYVPKGSSKINTIIGNGKRFLAYEIIQRLIKQGQNDLLNKLADGVTDVERKRNKQHQVFQPSSDIKCCYSDKMIYQKLNYIHDNPVAGKWQLVDDYLAYPHSSARFYDLDEPHPKVEITHFRDL